MTRATVGLIAALGLLAGASPARADRLDGEPDLVAVDVERGYAYAVAADGGVWSMEVRRGLWRKEAYSGGGSLLSVSIAGRRDVWIAGAAGVLAHFDGDQWTSPPGKRTRAVRAVAFSTRTRGIAVGDDGAVFNFVRGWQPFVAMTRKPSLYAVARIGRGGRERFVAVGAGGDGMSFTGVGSSLAADDEMTGVKADLVAIDGCTDRSKAETVAVGTDAVLRDKTGAWRKLPEPPAALTGVAVACKRGAVTAVFATTAKGIAVYDAGAGAWTERALDDASGLRDIAWLDRKRLIAVGDKGAVVVVEAKSLLVP